MTAKPARQSRPKCLHLRCKRRATVLLHPRYGVDWPGCNEHYPAMQDALFIGQSSSDAEVSVVRLTTTHPERSPMPDPTLSDVPADVAKTEPGKAFPDRVHRDTLRRIVVDLGFDPTDVREFRIGPTFCEVTVYVREPEHGNRVKCDSRGAVTRDIVLAVTG